MLLPRGELIRPPSKHMLHEKTQLVTNFVHHPSHDALRAVMFFCVQHPKVCSEYHMWRKLCSWSVFVISLLFMEI